MMLITLINTYETPGSVPNKQWPYFLDQIYGHNSDKEVCGILGYESQYEI